ncbi:MAG TPA: S8 family serine peptidase [Bryobacteraceae bacterium]|jgi:uncharacterized protein (TIGR03437 family)
MRAAYVLLWTLTAVAATAAEPRTADFALVLNAPSLSEQARTPNRQAHATLADIQAQQQSLRSELLKRSIPVFSSASKLVNAVFVRVPMSRAAELGRLPGVRMAIYLPPLRPHLNRALDLVQASAGWSQVGGMANAGAGVKIAIIDSGIDQTHPAMQDPGLQPPAGFPKGVTSFTNNKVIVARSYVSQLPFPNADPQHSLPDDLTPSDHFGHGTAIAMIAAGESVKAPIATISGIAPKAFLGNYKVYGTPGLNDPPPSAGVIIPALEDALNDGMDIAVLSSGNAALTGPFDQVGNCQPTVSRPYIPGAACDILAFAVENAISSGMTVVVSAGDDGASGYNAPTLATINSPATAPNAITVGATTNSHVLYSTVSVSGSGVPSNLTAIDALFGEAPKPGSAFTAPIVDVTTLGDDGQACSPLPANSLTGAVALIQRGTCYFDYKANNAKTAGAVAVLMYLASGDDLFTPTSLEDTAAPFVMIGNTAGAALKSYLASHPGTKVTLDPAWHEESSTADTVAYYSSRGPSIGTYSNPPVSVIKPDLVAPGDNIYTASQRLDPNGALYDASGFITVEGTSFSTALVAGAVALVKQAHPSYTPAQLKSAVVNTATTANLQDESGGARTNSVGAGKLNVPAALGAQVSVSPSSIAFGRISVTLPSLSLALTNAGASSVSLTIAAAQRDADSHAQVNAPSSITVPAGQTVNLTVALTGSRPNPGSYDGQLNLTGSGVNLHIPYNYVVGDGVFSTGNVFPILGDAFVGGVGEAHAIAARVTDQYGVPIDSQPVTWTVNQGGGQLDSTNGIPNADVETDIYGSFAATVDLGNQVGDQIFTGNVSGTSWEFDLYALLYPAIAPNGIVNGASFQATPAAPGSYITISGQNLAHVTANYITTNLPVAIAATSVSFDAPGVSVPGHISYISPGQVNVQVPWELQGQSSAQVKVVSSNLASVLSTLPMAAYGPAAFEYTGSDGQLYAAALDTSGQLITNTHPAQRGQYISLYANGLGQVTNQPASGAPSPEQPLAQSNPLSAISVTIGGRTAQISFAGLAPDYVGLYQLNLVVPTDSPSGVQPMVITGNGVVAKTTQLAVSP